MEIPGAGSLETATMKWEIREKSVKNISRRKLRSQYEEL
jgi:hypothetical protein